MSFDLTNFDDPTLNEEYLTYLVEQEAVDSYLHFARLWDYFRNPIGPVGGVAARALNTNSRPYLQAQEAGLPARITGINRFGVGAEQLTDLARKEVVIENDIAWRVQTMIEFLFGKPVSIRSLARNPAVAGRIESAVKALFDANGGQTFFQELALMGSIYGLVDVVVRLPGTIHFPSHPSLPTPAPAGRDPSGSTSASTARPPAMSADGAEELVRQVVLEPVEASRVMPVLDENDYRSIRYWVQVFRKRTTQLADGPRPFVSFGWGGRQETQPRMMEVVEIIAADWWQRYEDRRLVAEGPNPLGRLPVVHIQNLSLPGGYEGLSDVEPLVPLQDELNTRLSDRASRVTYQSFKMYLAKGIDDFMERPIGPGQMWATHNLNASVQEFGHDAGSPSESDHIEQVRQAMDKLSGVTPLAAGLVRGHVGNLTSATALKVLLSGLLSRTERKRITYGRGLASVIDIVLGLLDRTGVLRTDPRDRRVEIHWPSPLPEDESQRLANARIKLDLGVPAPRVLSELGYDRENLNPAAEAADVADQAR